MDLKSDEPVQVGLREVVVIVAATIIAGGLGVLTMIGALRLL